MIKRIWLKTEYKKALTKSSLYYNATMSMARYLYFSCVAEGYMLLHVESQAIEAIDEYLRGNRYHFDRTFTKAERIFIARSKVVFT